MRLRNCLRYSAIALSLILAAGAAAQQNGTGPNGPQKDPNFPLSFDAAAVASIPIYWTAGNPTRPIVHFKNPTADGHYMGFDDKGSWIQNMDGKIYRWNFKELKLTVIANNIREAPLDEVASLRNTDQTVQYWLAQHGVGPKPAPAAPPPPPPNPDKSGGLFGNDPRKSLQGLAPAPGSPADIAGKNASIQGGVLTFTMSDGTKSKPYNVARPAFMANAPQATSVAGTWLALQDGGKGIMFNVQADNSVTGKEISPQVAQMLMQSAPKAH